MAHDRHRVGCGVSTRTCILLWRQEKRHKKPRFNSAHVFGVTRTFQIVIIPMIASNLPLGSREDNHSWKFIQRLNFRKSLSPWRPSINFEAIIRMITIWNVLVTPKPFVAWNRVFFVTFLLTSKRYAGTCRNTATYLMAVVCHGQREADTSGCWCMLDHCWYVVCSYGCMSYVGEKNSLSLDSEFLICVCNSISLSC